MIKTILSILLFLLLPIFGYAGIYSWTDENGVRHFSNSPPEESIEKIHQTEEYVGRKNKDIEPRKKDDRHQKSSIETNQIEKSKAEDKKKQGKYGEVIIYTTPTCGYCHRAKAFLSKQGVRYKEYNIKASEKVLKKFRSLNGRGVPLIVIGDKRITGFNKSAIKSALGIP
jgi:glutaredoxin